MIFLLITYFPKQQPKFIIFDLKEDKKLKKVIINFSNLVKFKFLREKKRWMNRKEIKKKQMKT